MTTIPEEKYGKPNLGNNVRFVDHPNFGSEPYLITIGDDTTISFDCAFVTHDGGARVVRNLFNDQRIFIGGPITIGKNCFVGCRCVILPNVTIGDNVIIGAGSIVNRSIPSNSVAAGVPCKVICTINEYIEKHRKDFLYVENFKDRPALKELLLTAYKEKLPQTVKD